tara:strand:- start:3877 stop:6711 length:2835 start_codon:yes stop_codon:yes gene_type:complete
MADNPNPFFADAPGQKKVNPETKKKTKKKAQTQQQEQQDVANKMTVGDKPKSYTAKAIKDALTEDSLVGNLEEDELFGDMSLTFDDTEGLFAVEETTEMELNLALHLNLDYPGNKLFIEDVNTDFQPVSDLKQRDPFRQDVGNFWTMDGASVNLKQKPMIWANELDKTMEQIVFPSEDLKTPIRMNKIETLEAKSHPGKVGKPRIEKYQVKIDNLEKITKDNELNPDFLNNYFAKVFKGGVKYTDYNFVMDTPSRAAATAYGDKGNFVQVKSNYNFLNKSYEQVTNPSVVDEKLLPNLYTYMLTLEENSKILNSNTEVEIIQSWLGTKTITDSPIFNHLTLNNQVDGFILSANGYLNPGANNIENETITRYFNSWSDTLTSIDDSTPEDSGVITQNFQRLIFPKSSAQDIFKYNSDVDDFPMSVNVKLTSGVNKSFHNLIKQTNTGLVFTYDTLDGIDPLNTTFVESDGPGPILIAPRPLYDFEQILNRLLDGELDLTEPLDNAIYFGDTSQTVDGPGHFLGRFGLKAKLVDLINQKSRSFSQILKGVPAYSETLFYEVQKYTATDEGELIDLKQTFLISNDNQTILDLFDTQVKYNTYYAYRIYAHRIIVGTNYKYNLVKDGPTDSGPGPFNADKANLAVTLEPALRIARIPYYNVNELSGDREGSGIHKTTIVLDSPPLTPEVEFIPTINKPRDIIINLKDVKGSVKTFSKNFGSIGAIQHLAIMKQQYINEFDVAEDKLINVNLEKNKLLFNSDESALFFEIYQTKVKPIDYSDFSSSLFSVVDGPNNSIGLKMNFNQKIYFTFRTIDFHGNYSNLSEIYQVEIKESNGLVYPVIEILNLEKEREKEKELQEATFISGKRFVYIRASSEQTELSKEYVEEVLEETDQSDAENLNISHAINAEGDSVFNPKNKFKIRIKSKKTGKIVELNLRCKQPHSNIVY